MDEVDLIEELFITLKDKMTPFQQSAIGETLFCGEPDSALIVMKNIIWEQNIQVPEKFSPIL